MRATVVAEDDEGIALQTVNLNWHLLLVGMGLAWRVRRARRARAGRRCGHESLRLPERSLTRSPAVTVGGPH